MEAENCDLKNQLIDKYKVTKQKLQTGEASINLTTLNESITESNSKEKLYKVQQVSH